MIFFTQIRKSYFLFSDKFLKLTINHFLSLTEGCSDWKKSDLIVIVIFSRLARSLTELKKITFIQAVFPVTVILKCLEEK